MILQKAEIINNDVLRKISAQIETHFIGAEKERLINNSKQFGIDNLQNFFEKVFLFFDVRLNVDTLTIEDIRKIDLKELSYDFIEFAGISKPEFSSKEEQLESVEILSKVARIFLHEILFPKLNDLGENLRNEVSTLIKIAVKRISLVENFNEKYVMELLRLDELEVTKKIGFVIHL